MDAYARFADPSLALPVGGRSVAIPPPTARVGLALRHQLLALDGKPFGVVEERVAIRRILGEKLYADLADEFPEAILLHIGRTAIMHWGGGHEQAMAHWDRELAALAKAEKDAEPVDESVPGFLGPDDPGGGPIDYATGIRRWYNDPVAAPSKAEPLRLSWRDILASWDDVELDLHDIYGVDLGGDILDRRTWPWLELRVMAIATTPNTRLSRAILAPLYAQ